MEAEESKKSWIKILAEQSWEAELVVSGIAIFGALSLPAQLDSFMDWLFLRLTDTYLNYASVLILYLYFALQVMIAGFLIHFVLRVTWIGFVGLYSVFPEGIKSIPMYSEDFNAKLKKTFPSLEGYVKQLDDASSIIFAAANSAILSMFSICLTGTIFIVLAALIHLVLPGIQLQLILLVLVIILITPVMLSSFLHLPKLREKEWVKAIHFPIYYHSSLALLNIAFKPLSHLILTFYSNVKVQYFIIPFIGVAFVFGIVGGGRLATSTLPFFEKDRYFDHGKRENYALPGYYQDQKDEDDIVLHAMIPSSNIEGPYLEIFLPKLGRERASVDEYCDKLTNEKGEDGSNKSTNLECLSTYNEFFIDDSLLIPVDVSYSRLVEKGQRGYTFVLDLERIPKGPHTLRIKKQYFLRDGTAKTVRIPFLYVPKHSYQTSE